MNIKQKVTSAVILGSFALTVFAPVGAFAAQSNGTIKNNGPFSWNSIFSVTKKKTSVSQNNTTKATTNTTIISNTGKNKSGFNVGWGGNNTITSGDSTTNVGVVVVGGSNATIDECDCEESSSTSTISNNGPLSKNTIVSVNKSKKSVSQNNTTISNTNTTVVSNTGKNSTGFNGGNSSSITSGNSDTSVFVLVGGSANINN